MLYSNKTKVISPCPFMNLSVLHDVEQPNSFPHTCSLLHTTKHNKSWLKIYGSNMFKNIMY